MPTWTRGGLTGRGSRRAWASVSTGPVSSRRDHRGRPERAVRPHLALRPDFAVRPELAVALRRRRRASSSPSVSRTGPGRRSGPSRPPSRPRGPQREARRRPTARPCSRTRSARSSASATARGDGASATVQVRAERAQDVEVAGAGDAAGRRRRPCGPTSSAGPSPWPGSASGPAGSSAPRSPATIGDGHARPRHLEVVLHAGVRRGRRPPGGRGAACRSASPAARVDTMRLPGATRSGLAKRSKAVGPRDEYVAMRVVAMVGGGDVVGGADRDHLRASCRGW